MTRAQIIVQQPRPLLGTAEVVRLVVFRLNEHRYALPLTAVERIVRAVAVTPLPSAPTVVLGIIDVAGHVLPVFDVRRRLQLPEREVHSTDQFVIAHAAQRTVVLHVDDVDGVIECPAVAIIAATSIVANSTHIRGVIQLDSGLVLIHDLEQFLSLDEVRALNEALKGVTDGR